MKHLSLQLDTELIGPFYGVLFDLDGTLVDTMPYYYRAWVETMKRFELTIDELTVYRREGEKAEITAADCYRAERGQEPSERCVREIVSLRDKIFAETVDVRFFPSALEFAAALRTNGIGVGVVSGSTDLKKKYPHQMEFFGTLDALVTGDDTEKGKPEPEPFRCGIDKLSILPHHCLVIENAPLGLRSAVSAGARAVCVRNGSPIPDEELASAGAHWVSPTTAELFRRVRFADPG